MSFKCGFPRAVFATATSAFLNEILWMQSLMGASPHHLAMMHFQIPAREPGYSDSKTASKEHHQSESNLFFVKQKKRAITFRSPIRSPFFQDRAKNAACQKRVFS
jgi:hypothetical protein